MPTYSQENRPLGITTPLGKDILLLTAMRGHEAISELFNFQLDLLAELESEIRFDAIVGQSVTVNLQLPNGEKRYFNGLINRFSQGARDDTFAHFRAQLVPKLWLLTKKVRCRIFQHLDVPEILHQVLTGLDVKYELLSTYYPRDYCVQYRESDFQFASRLMEEEGIFYFFEHTDGNHKMTVTDVPGQHPSIAGQTDVIYDEASGATKEDMRIYAWEKTQELRSGECTFWDHCFELPGNHLEAQERTSGSVTVGKVTHNLNVGGNDQLEIYDYPGGYAQRFDGIDRNGQPRPADIKQIFPDSKRLVRVRMEQEEVASLEIQGASDCGHFVPGHKFNLERHFDADDSYLLTRVEHDARLDNYQVNQRELVFNYGNRFSCIPAVVPYRPVRVTLKPVIAGIQTATVVGPPGEEIFCDKYGRVKVQFHWDREGKKNADSSCWLRVSQVWAGKGWGAFFWPRIGHEVVVIFEEGDPDQPLIVGSVYNAENMPPFYLPDAKMFSGFRSSTMLGKSRENFNGILFIDKKGNEHLAIHSERHMELNAEFDKIFHGGRHKGERVASASVLTVGTLPGGGGSGGGGQDTPWPKPYPQGVGGLNSVMVYGANLQSAVGINHQLVVGSNFQVCLNPFGLLALIDGLPDLPGFTETLGSGIGGNMQFTIGTSAQVTFGRSFEINLGQPKLEFECGTMEEDPASFITLGLIGAAILAYVIAYGLLDGDRERANTTIIFQAAMDVLLALLMHLETEKGQAEKKVDTAQYKLFKADNANWTFGENKGLDWAAIGAGAAVIGALVAPLVLIAEHESDAYDSTGKSS